MSSKITVETEDRGSFLLLKIEGELSERTVSAFKKTASAEIEERGHTHMVLDFAECSYVNSTGIAALHVLGKKLTNLGGKLGVINPNDSVREVISTVPDDGSLFREYKDLEEAAADLTEEE
jgi:stage II sporulation protein AA (anti-sigma F factor antagonist)